MITTLALTLGGPLMLLFGIMMAAVAGLAGGYLMGVNLGKTRPETPLPTTIRLTRDLLANTTGDLEKASKKLNEAQRPELAGSTLVLARRLSELSSALGRIGHKAKHEEGSA